MQTYENRYFGFRLNIPDNWQLTSWKHLSPGFALEPRSGYQARDDELPQGGTCASLFLFTAALHPPESDALVDADIEMSVFRLAPGEDIRASIVENLERERAYYASNGIERSIVREGAWNLGGTEFRYVDEESKTRRELSKYRFFFRSLGEGLCMYGKVAGHRAEAFENAISIAETLESIP